MTEEPKQRLTLEEIREALDDIARDPDNRDRFKALKMRASEETSSVTLPEPMGDGEIIERLMRVMKPAGQDLCQVAYQRAFPNTKSLVSTIPQLRMNDLTEEQKAQVENIRTLKQLYRAFPEIKRHGVPTGYPSGRGLEVQQAWCRRRASKILLDREQARLDAIDETDRLIRESSGKDNGPQEPPPAA